MDAAQVNAAGAAGVEESGPSAAAKAPLGAQKSPLGARQTLAPEALLAEIGRIAADRKAQEIVAVDLRGLVSYTDYFLLCTGNTERQTKAIHDAITEGLAREHRLRPRRVEGLLESRWILMDYLDVVVHVFTPATREFYRLETLWGEAPTRVLHAEAGPAGGEPRS